MYIIFNNPNYIYDYQKLLLFCLYMLASTNLFLKDYVWKWMMYIIYEFHRGIEKASLRGLEALVWPQLPSPHLHTKVY